MSKRTKSGVAKKHRRFILGTRSLQVKVFVKSHRLRYFVDLFPKLVKREQSGDRLSQKEN